MRQPVLTPNPKAIADVGKSDASYSPPIPVADA